MDPIQLSRTSAGPAPDLEFMRQVERESGQDLRKCYQCGNCTAGCPMSFIYDYPVSRIMRLLQLGQKETVLSSRALWLCATCETCTTRCPNNIEVAKIMDVCRHMSRREGRVSGLAARNVRLFTDSFLRTVRWGGRASELASMVLFKLSSGRLFSDLTLAPEMLGKGKLKILPRRAAGHEEVAAIFRRFDAGEHLRAAQEAERREKTEERP